MQKAREQKQVTTKDGDRIRILPDYTQIVMELRAAFNEVRGMLRSCEGVRFGLWYREIAVDGGVSKSFKDPKMAKDSIMANLKRKDS